MSVIIFFITGILLITVQSGYAATIGDPIEAIGAGTVDVGL